MELAIRQSQTATTAERRLGAGPLAVGRKAPRARRKQSSLQRPSGVQIGGAWRPPCALLACSVLRLSLFVRRLKPPPPASAAARVRSRSYGELGGRPHHGGQSYVASVARLKDCWATIGRSTWGYN
jgi:hypothetical protein